MSAIVGVVKKTFALFAPPPKYSVATWAAEKKEIPRGSSAEPGKFRLERLPYQREIMESLTDETVSEVILEMARQTSKTEIILTLVGFIIDAAPCNILIKYPTREKSADFSQKKLTPMIRAMPCLRTKIRPHRERDSGNTIRSKLFPGGSISMVGANSAAGLRQLSCRVVIQDEIDSDKPNSEGDPVPQADATAANFHDAILVKASTPTTEPEDDGRGGKSGSRIQILFDDSDQRYWNVKCPRCQHWQVLRWGQMKWTWKQPDGTQVSDPTKAVYLCAGCNAELTDYERVRMVMDGRWVAKKPGSHRRGYHLSGLYRIMGKKRAYKTYLHEFVEQFLKAKKDGSLEVWTNTFLAECWKLQLSKIETDPIMERREKYGPELPEKVLVLTRQVDVQGDRLEIMVKGWGLGYESWGVKFMTLLGNPHEMAVWKRLDEVLAEEYQHPILGKLHVPITLIDSGGQSQDQGFAMPVYAFVRPRQPSEYGPGVYATKGASRVDAPLVSNRRPKQGICLKVLGSGLAKTTIHARLRMTEHGPRYMHYPAGLGFDAEYFEQLGAEAPKQVRKKGYTYTEWIKIRARNEALDLEAMSLAAIEILNPDFHAIAAKVRERKPESEPEKKTETGDPRPVRPPMRRIFRLAKPRFGRKW